jgi:hypothetical protein
MVIMNNDMEKCGHKLAKALEIEGTKEQKA